jgi:hypothetical protein
MYKSVKVYQYKVSDCLKLCFYYWLMTLTLMRVNLLAQEITDKKCCKSLFSMVWVGPGN